MPATHMAEVVDRLVATFGSATGLQVVDGPLLGQLMSEAVVVGFAPESWGYTAQVTRQEGFGRPELQEEWSVRSMLTLTSGGGRMATLRTRAATLLDQMDTAVRDDHVNAVWEWAHLSGDVQWQPAQHEGGATMSVMFSVDGMTLL